MRSVNQTAKALCALAKTLADNATRTTDQERESLTEAVFKTVMENKSEIGMISGQCEKEERNAVTV